MFIKSSLLGILMISNLAFAANPDVVGVLLAGGRHSFWRAMKKGVEQAAIEFNYSTSINTSLDDQTETQNIAAQKAALAVFEKRNCKGIIWAPIQNEVGTYKENPNIPMVFVDRTFADKNKVVFVATDGKKAAFDSLTKFNLGNKIKKVGIMGLSKDVLSTEERQKGYLDAIKKNHLELVFNEYIGHGVNPSSELAKQLIEKHPEVDLILTVNETTTAAVLMAVEKLTTGREPKIIGFDYKEEFFDAVKKSIILGLIVQDPQKIGYTAMKLIFETRNGSKLKPGPRFIEPIFLHSGNLNQQAIQVKLDQFK